MGLVEGVLVVKTDDELDDFLINVDIELMLGGKYKYFDGNIIEFELVNLGIGLVNFWEVLKFLTNPFSFDLVVEYFALFDSLVEFMYLFKFHD